MVANEASETSMPPGIPTNLFPRALWLPWLVLREKETRLPPLMGSRNPRPVTRNGPLKPAAKPGLQARAEQTSKTQKTTASVRSVGSWKITHNKSFQPVATQTATVDNGSQAEHLRENFRPLAKKTHTEGRRHKAARSIIYSWDHVCFIDQNQGPQFILSTGWETRNNILLGVSGLENKTTMVPAFATRTSWGKGEFSAWEAMSPEAWSPHSERLPGHLWGSHAVLTLGHLIHKCLPIKCHSGQGHMSPGGWIF